MEVAEKTAPAAAEEKIVEKVDEAPQDATMDENEEEKLKRAARQSACILML